MNKQRNENEMMVIRKTKNICLILPTILFLAGCTLTPLFKDYEKAVHHFREDVLNFYDTLSDAYFILGYEYYELANEFEKKGNPERAAYYQDKATIYYNLSKDLKNAAAETRRFSKSPQDQYIHGHQ